MQEFSNMVYTSSMLFQVTLVQTKSIQYSSSITDGRIAEDHEKIGEINPNTWDAVTRIYLCRKEEFSFSRSRCMLTTHYKCMSHINLLGASFARDFLEMERQQQRDDSEFAYSVTEFRSK